MIKSQLQNVLNKPDIYYDDDYNYDDDSSKVILLTTSCHLSVPLAWLQNLYRRLSHLSELYCSPVVVLIVP